MTETIISPIFYMGNKRKLINKGLTDLFPYGCKNFVEPFAGSAVVSLNVRAENYYINDISPHLYSLYSLFKTTQSDIIIEGIKSNILKYRLAQERTKRNEYKDKDKIELYKKAYMELRSVYNEQTRNIIDFYTLMFYSFSQQFRFNSKGEFNMPCGNDCFSVKNEEYIKTGCEFFSNDNVYISNLDFRNMKFSNDDFVYLDPPYYNTTATYNENNAWTRSDEEDMYSLCESLNQKGVKWGMSNIFENKNIRNQDLINWCLKNNWYIFAFDKFSYRACGKGNSNAQEVYICNY